MALPLRRLLMWLLLSQSALILIQSPGAGATPALDLHDTSRLRLGVGDRISVLSREAEAWVSVPEEALRKGVPLDLFEVWLPRGWDEDWVKRERLQELTAQGITPVIIHYYFGDAISKERVEAERDGWYSSMWRMANMVRMDAPVLIVLEPEFNIAPPEGETAITSWPWFAKDLAAAVEMIRTQAPNALIGTCPGDFSGTPHLEPVLGPLASDLDFLAFQEMRAATDPEAGRKGYLDVGRAATDYARYLKRAFGRPLLLAYVAVSSHGHWEKRQADALRDLRRHRDALLGAGVFGLVYFQLRDDPSHIGYFGAAERHFGLLRADGTPKPALEVFRALGR